MPLLTITAIASASSIAEMYPKVMIPGSLALPLLSEIQSTIAAAPPECTINFYNSVVYFAISLMHVAAFLRTYTSISFKQFNILGNISASTTTSAKSTVCFAICAKQLHTCLFNYASGCEISAAKYGTAP